MLRHRMAAIILLAILIEQPPSTLADPGICDKVSILHLDHRASTLALDFRIAEALR